MLKRIIGLIIISSLALGCVQESPSYLAKQGEYFYKKAIAAYERLVKKEKRNVAHKIELARLYLRRGDFTRAIETLKGQDDKASRQILGAAFYKAGDYTQALGAFERAGKISEDEYLYYYGLTCQKQNLYEKALELFSRIKGREYSALAQERIFSIQGLNLSGLDLSDELKGRIAQATQEKYPLAGAVMILVDETVKLFSDNTLVSDARYVIKILNERGKKDFAEVVIGYDSTYEKVELEYARTIKPAGEVIMAGEKDIRDVSRYMNFPLYSNARARIISMPEISEGAIIDYRVRTTQNQLINKEDFDLAYSLKENEPVLQAKFSLDLPKGRKLKLKVLNPEYNSQKTGQMAVVGLPIAQATGLEPKINETASGVNYLWEFKDIPQIELEPDMPPATEVDPIIMMSTFDSWDEIYKWWWELTSDRISADSAIREKTQELIKGKNTPEEKIRAVYNYCVQDIRYVGVEYGQAGYQPHPAAEIFKNKYGDCKDKAILFIAMLKAAGIEGYPVLIGTRGTPATSRDFPALNFNHCIAAVELDEKIIFLDITAEVCSFGDLPADDQERTVLLFKKDGYELITTPLLSPRENVIRYQTDMALGRDESVSARREVSGLGQFDQAQRFWLRYTPPNLIEESLKQKVQSLVTSGDLISYKYENADNLDLPIKLTYEFAGRNFLSRAGKARIMPQFTRIDTSSSAKLIRVYPLELGQPSINEAVFSIRLPLNFKIKYLPESRVLQSPWIDYEVEYKLKGDTLTVTQRQSLKKRQASVQEYPQFKKFLEEAAILLDEHIILEKK